MAYATGSKRYLAFIREVTAGTTPTTPVLKKIRNTGGNGISNERSSLQSGEIRGDRGISDVRLGQNQPGISIPFEFSYAAFDSLLEGAFGSRWQGGFVISAIVDFLTSPASTIDHASGTDWTTLGLKVGDYIVVSSTDEAGNAGIYKISNISNGAGTNDRLTVTAADGSTAVTFTADTDDTVTIMSGAKGGTINSATNNITIAATGKTYTTANNYWLTTLELEVGDYIYFSGFTTAGNNGWKKVVTVTDKVLAVNETCTNETKTTGTVEIGSNVGILVTGTGDLDSFTIEEGFSSITQYHSLTGAKVDSFNINAQPDKMIDGEFAFQGMTYTPFAASSIASSLTEAETNSPFDSYTGSLSLNSGTITEATAVISGMKIQLNNSLSRRFALMSQNAAGVGEGRVNVTGSINAYLKDAVLPGYFSAETEFTASLRMIDLDGNAYVFYLPRVKFTKDSRTISENDVTEALDFQALIDSSNVTLQITKQPKAA